MDNTNLYILILALSILVSVIMEAILLPRIINIAKEKKLYDIPDARKKHDVPIPRLGGLSFMPVIVFTTFISLFVRYKLQLWDEGLIDSVFPEFILIICGMFLIYLLGIKDDLVGVGFKKKFLIQFIASSFIIAGNVYIQNLHGLFGIYEISPSIGIPISIILIVFTTNAINLIDGADGLASGLSAIAFIVYGLLFFVSQMWTYATMAFAIVGLLIPFFYYNFFHPTKKIFMGDTGSLTLGYISAFMMLRLFQTEIPCEMGINPCAYFVLITSALFIPLYDAARVMLVRVFAGRSPFSPDRNHIHHKLIDLGLSRRKAVSVIIFAGIVLFLLNVVFAIYLDCTIVFILDIILATSIAFLFVFLNKKIDTKRKIDG